MTGAIVVYSTVTDWTCRGVAVAGWLLLWHSGRTVGRRGPLPPLWHAGLLLAIATTLRTVPITLWLDALTGQRWFSVPLAHLLAIAAAAIVTTARLGVLHPLTGRHRAGVAVTAVAVAAGLAITWVIASLGGSVPGSAGFVPGSTAEVAAGPAMVVHQTVFAGAALLATSVVGGTLLLELAAAPVGPIRLQLGLLIGTAGCGALWAVAQGVVALAAALGACPDPGTRGLIDLAAAGAVAALLAAVGAVDRRLLHDPPADPGRARDHLAQLRDRLAAGGARHTGSDDLFGLLIEVRDRMWLLQQRVTPDQLDRARAAARAVGLVGGDAHAFTAAVALEVALHTDPDTRAARPADIARLGGGDTEEDEAAWLSRVETMWAAQPVEPAAVWVGAQRGSRAGSHRWARSGVRSAS